RDRKTQPGAESGCRRGITGGETNELRPSAAQLDVHVVGAGADVFGSREIAGEASGEVGDTIRESAEPKGSERGIGPSSKLCGCAAGRVDDEGDCDWAVRSDDAALPSADERWRCVRGWSDLPSAGGVGAVGNAAVPIAGQQLIEHFIDDGADSRGPGIGEQDDRQL